MKKILMFVLSFVMLLGSAFAISGCFGGDDGEKSIKNLTYNGTTITWSSVKNAKNYLVTVDGVQGVVQQAEGTISYPYDAEGADFDFKVEAVIKSGSDKNPTYTIRFQNLGTVTGLKVEAGKLKWDANANAEKYEVMYNGNIVSSNVGTTEYATQAGQFNYKVRALKGQAESVDGNIPYYSLWSETLSGTVLSAPNNLSYNSETATFSWDTVEGATKYKIKIGNDTHEVTGNTFDNFDGTQDFNVSVSAVGNPTNSIYDSLPCEEKEYRYITPISGLNVVNGALVWSPSTNATRYKLKLNGVVQTSPVTTTTYTNINPGESIRVQILPIGVSEFYFSRWSEEITVNILRAPVVSYGDSVIRWNQVTGAEGYEINIIKDGGVVFNTSAGAEVFVYNYAFPESGDYQVEVKATILNTGNGVYESKYSNPFPVRRLATPTNKEVINRPEELNQLSVNFTPSTGAVKHVLKANNIDKATITSGNTFNVDVNSLTETKIEEVINFKIFAQGEVTGEYAILDCLTPLEFTATRLGQPQNVTISGSQLSWGSVANTNKYLVTIGGSKVQVTTNSYTITDMVPGNQNIYVQAMGNGQEVITGCYSNALSVTKLATPTGLTITNGILSWSTVPGATAYRVLLGGQEYDPVGATFPLASYDMYIQAGVGTQLSVYAVGNGSNIINSDVSATKTISKYAKVGTPAIQGANIKWGTVSVNSIPCNNYLLYINDEDPIAVTGDSYPLSSAEFNTAGEYTIQVVAAGDNVNTLNSPISDEYTFTKLGNITNLQKVGNKYTWDAVTGATSYEVKTSYMSNWETIGATPEYTPSFPTVGLHNVAFRAVSATSNVVSSNVHSFDQQVNTISKLMEDTDFTVSVTNYDVTITFSTVDGASGFKVLLDAMDVTSRCQVSGNTYTLRLEDKAEHNLQVVAKGGSFAANGTYMLDSNDSTPTKVKYTASA